MKNFLLLHALDTAHALQLGQEMVCVSRSARAVPGHWLCFSYAYERSLTNEKNITHRNHHTPLV